MKRALRATLVRVLLLLEFCHQRGDAPRRRNGKRSERGAGDSKLLRVKRGARNRERGLHIARGLPRERLDTRQALAGGIARSKIRIGIGQVGMRIEPPCRLDDAPCPSRIARLRQQPAGKRSRRYEARCKLRRLHRKLPGAVAVRILRGDGLRGQQDRALALIRSLIEQPALEVVLEPMQRARPVARNTAELEHGMPRPPRHRVVPRSLLRMQQCGPGVVAPPRLDEQPV